MNERIIAEWNVRVQPDEWVLHLGDFAFGPREQLAAFRRRLNGRILLVAGNHDRSPRVMESLGIDRAVKAYDFEFGGLRYRCRHNPAAFTPEEARAADVLMHGHTHSRLAGASVDPEVRAKALCVSVEQLPESPAPVSVLELERLLRVQSGRKAAAP